MLSGRNSIEHFSQLQRQLLLNRAPFAASFSFLIQVFHAPSLWSQTLPFKVPNILHLSKNLMGLLYSIWGILSSGVEQIEDIGRNQSLKIHKFKGSFKMLML